MYLQFLNINMDNNVSFGMGFIRPTGKNLEQFNEIMAMGCFSETTRKRGFMKLEKDIAQSSYDIRFDNDRFEILDKNGNVLENIHARNTKYPGLFDRGLNKYHELLNKTSRSSELLRAWVALKAVCSMIYDSMVVKMIKPEESLPDSLRFAKKRVLELEKQNFKK